MYKVMNDGAVWLLIDKSTAIAIFNADKIHLCAIYRDETVCMIKSINDINRVDRSGLKIGIEVGYVKDLLPKCPKCGCKLIPSRVDGYTWECLSCDEDFYSFEI